VAADPRTAPAARVRWERGHGHQQHARVGRLSCWIAPRYLDAVSGLWVATVSWGGESWTADVADERAAKRAAVALARKLAGSR
jgi:hypothetical protein